MVRNVGGVVVVLLLAAIACCCVHGEECNGRGMRYELEEGSAGAACECFSCFGGAECENLMNNCAIEARVAEATMWTEWFARHAGELAVDISSTYHLGYLQSPRLFSPAAVAAQATNTHASVDDAPSVPNRVDHISRMLNESIRALHASVITKDGNHPCFLDEMTLVVGSGGVQLIDAALYALTQGNNTGKQMYVYAKPPYYPHFRMESKTNPLTRWASPLLPLAAPNPPNDQATTTTNANKYNSSTIIEIITTPNNPDGDQREEGPVFPGAGAKLYDLVYDWPHYPAADKQAHQHKGDDGDIRLYSLSKLTGHAATRLGWAFVRDPQVASVMSQYIWLQSTASSVESQLRATKVLQAITRSRNTPDDFFLWARAKLEQRWQRLQQVFQGQSRFTIEGRSGILFMWVKCATTTSATNNNNNEQQTAIIISDCAAQFAPVGIAADSGDNYGASTSFARICIGHDQATFDLMLERLDKLLRKSAAAAAATTAPLSASPSPPSSSSSTTTITLVDDDDAAAAASSASRPLPSRSDIRRAQEQVPRASFTGGDYESMVAALNSHLVAHAKAGRIQAQLLPCESLTLPRLHDIQRRLHQLRSPSLQSIYEEVEDHRSRAFADTQPSIEAMQARHTRELELASIGGEDVEHLLRNAACHLAVMQFAHHLPEESRASLSADEILPLLPRTQPKLVAAPATSATSAAAGDETSPSSLAAAAASQPPPPPHVREARALYANATACITCHTATAADSSKRTTQQPQHQPPLAPAPFVPLWPKGFSATFGLSTQDMTNITSRVAYTAEIPSMHIHHSKCPAHFFPIMPKDADYSSCDLHFLPDGLSLAWQSRTENNRHQQQQQHCCSLVRSNMTLNLGQHELGGFDFVENTTVSDYFGNAVAVERWVSSASLAPPSDFEIFIDRATGLDVHYRNGGPYKLEWALAPWNITHQPREDFMLPAGIKCDTTCTRQHQQNQHQQQQGTEKDDNSYGEVHRSLHSVWRRRSGLGW